MTARLTDEELAEHIARARGCASAELPGETLRSLLAEVRELRAYKAQVERVKECPGDSLDECVNGARATLGTRGIDGNCVKCKGLP